jgi:hypothetical protein
MRNKIPFPGITIILMVVFLLPSIVTGQVNWQWEGYWAGSWVRVDDSVN